LNYGLMAGVLLVLIVYTAYTLIPRLGSNNRKAVAALLAVTAFVGTAAFFTGLHESCGEVGPALLAAAVATCMPVAAVAIPAVVFGVLSYFDNHPPLGRVRGAYSRAYSRAQPRTRAAVRRAAAVIASACLIAFAGWVGSQDNPLCDGEYAEPADEIREVLEVHAPELLDDYDRLVEGA
jgi:hypothetical protein